MFRNIGFHAARAFPENSATNPETNPENAVTNPETNPEHAATNPETNPEQPRPILKIAPTWLGHV